MPGSARVHVDAETRQVLRVAKSTEIEPGEGLLADGGHTELALTFGGYETVDGVTLPRRMHMHFRLQVNAPEASLAEARREIEAMLAEAATDTSDDAAAAPRAFRVRRLRSPAPSAPPREPRRSRIPPDPPASDFFLAPAAATNVQ